MTDDEKARRRATKKATAINKKATKDVPLFADQVETTDAETEYWRWRFAKAKGGGSGQEGAYLAGVDWKVDLWLLRQLARRVMPPQDFALANSRQRDFGDIHRFWQNILLGQRRIVLEYTRISHGWRPVYLSDERLTYVEQVELKEQRVWPPDGYKPPLTPEELAMHLALPLPLDHPEAITIPEMRNP